MTTTVFFGASTVAGIGASNNDNRFSSLISRTMGWNEVNLGFPGSTVTGRDSEGQIIDEESGIGRVPDVLDAAPNRVIVLYGANDFVRSRTLGGAERFLQGTFFWDFDTLIRGLLFDLDPEQIILLTCPYRSDAEKANGIGLLLASYNSVIIEMGERHSVRVLDAWSGTGIDRESWPRYAADDCHLNDLGHQSLAAYCIESLR